MKAICIRDIIIDHTLFEEGKEYEFDESYVRYQKRGNKSSYYIAKVYSIKTGFFSHTTGYSEKATIITFGDIILSLECDVPYFYDFFDKTKTEEL